MSFIKICIVGLGYVGLPLARLFATKYDVIGYDINQQRIAELRTGYDNTNELDKDSLTTVTKTASSETTGLIFTDNLADITTANCYIITVPTPVDTASKPDLSILFNATKSIAQVLKKGDVVIYESTVYPGATEEECVPILEKISHLKFNTDFFVGYSPERINPGDKEHTIEKILKITSGSTPETANKVNTLYQSVIIAGTYLAPSIKVAEAAKAIENAQRDINIAFVNELAKIFNLMDIDTHAVLEAAGTKWNFLPFKPGLVGGHCIGVDPYYLAQKSKEFGYHPEIILAGRRLNDSMGSYVASQVIKLLLKKDLQIKGASILILGITFKENCPDVRNTRVVDVIKSLKEYDTHITIYDPMASPTAVKKEYQLTTIQKLPEVQFNAVVLAVAHHAFLNLNFRKLLKPNGVLYDVKGVITEKVDGRL